MTDGYEILFSILKATQGSQAVLSDAIGTASSTGIKSILQAQLRDYDSIESEAHLLASQRAWDVPAPSPLSDLLHSVWQHLMLCRRSDPRIAGLLIRHHTRAAMTVTRISHRSESYDEPINRLCQKLLFCQFSHVRQLLAFL